MGYKVWSSLLQQKCTLISTSYAADQVHFKHEQPLGLLIESHFAIGTIQQTQDAASVLWVYRHNSWHAPWPTVILRFMETLWMALVLSPLKSNKTKFREQYLRQNFDEVSEWSYTGHWLYA